MVDFTSALYLGMYHSSDSLAPWTRLTMGKPLALGAPYGQRFVENELAMLIGCQSASLGPSTLHLFWDLFGLLARDKIAIYLDSGVYPIARWGAVRAGARGVPVRMFAHHDPDALDRWLKCNALQRRRPVVVSDGFCPGCGSLAPLEEYLAKVRSYGGSLLIDDTQALGIFGRPRGADSPYGTVGGGSLQRLDLNGPDIVVINSLAKAFGAPLAVLAGSRTMVEYFEAHSETRVHTSPPSIAAVRAAQHALALNKTRGEQLRSHLAQLVRYFKKLLAASGFASTGGLFPVQSLKPVHERDAGRIHQGLLDLGVRTVLQRPRCRPGAVISFLITALHRIVDIEGVACALTKVFLNADNLTGKIMENDYEPFEYGFGKLRV